MAFGIYSIITKTFSQHKHIKFRGRYYFTANYTFRTSLKWLWSLSVQTICLNKEKENKINYYEYFFFKSQKAAGISGQPLVASSVLHVVAICSAGTVCDTHDFFFLIVTSAHIFKQPLLIGNQTYLESNLVHVLLALLIYNIKKSGAWS